jgi:hypothetical protein
MEEEQSVSVSEAYHPLESRAKLRNRLASAHLSSSPSQR